MNLLCGLVAVVLVFAGRSETAFVLMLAASFFDLCDGLAARALGAFSPIGGDLDSLSDMVSFGVLPSLMLHRLMRDSGAPCALCFIPLALAVFSALRLAKFNVDERQHESFLGLATPACAIFCGALAAYCQARPESWLAGLGGSVWFIPALCAGLCALLVCEVPMFSFKGKSRGLPGTKRTAFICISLIAAIVVAVFGLHWTLIPMGAVLVYICMNLIFAALKV